MGFINYHGNREDRYGDVVEYAQTQARLEQQKRDEKKKEEWFARLLGDRSASGKSINDLVKLAFSAYRDASDLYRQLIQGGQQKADALQLWKDLWLAGTYECIVLIGLQDEKQDQVLGVFTEKLLKLDNAVSAAQFVEAVRDNRKYRRYLSDAFSFEKDPKPEFWRFLTDSSASGVSPVVGITDGYGKYLLYLTCYLYKSAYPSDETWMRETEKRQSALEALKTAVRRRQIPVPSLKKLRNPLVAGGKSQSIFYRRTLVFKRSNLSRKRDEEEMVEDLYDYLKETPEALSEQTSILPSELKNQIKNGALPSFASATVSGLQPGEIIHYLEHMVWCREVDDSFEKVQGTLAITDKKVALRAAKNADIPLSSLISVTRYDMVPEVMEFRSEHNSYYIILPEPDFAYLVLKTLANREEGQAVQEAIVPLNYEELVEKADIGACIYAFECLKAYPIPEEMKEKISLLLVKIRALKKAIEQHPDRSSEVERFAEYYLPEAIRLVVSYNEYQDKGLDGQLIEQIYKSISDSIDTLDAAVEEKILSIYHIETIETQAKATALKLILEQEGYSQGKQILKH